MSSMDFLFSLPPNPLNLEPLTSCRRRKSCRGSGKERFDVGFTRWFESLTPLTIVDWRVELTGVHICEVEWFYVLSRCFLYIFLHFPFFVDYSDIYFLYSIQSDLLWELIWWKFIINLHQFNFHKISLCMLYRKYNSNNQQKNRKCRRRYRKQRKET